MAVSFVIAAAVMFQCAAAVLAIRLIWLTGRKWAWGLVAAAILLMVGRRGFALMEMAADGAAGPVSLPYALLGLAISVGLFVGLAGVSPLFASLQHLNAVLRAIRNVNQLITREKNRDRLLQGICDSLVDARGYHHAWIALCNGSEQPLAMAEAGFGEQFLPLRQKFEKGEPPPCLRETLGSPEVVVLSDSSEVCRDCLLCKQHRHGRAMVTRLASGDRVFGMMVATPPVGLAVDAEEQGLFAEAAGDIAFAIHSLRLEEEREQAEKALRLDESRLEALLRLNQMRDASLQELTDFALEEAVRLTESQIGYLAFMNDDESVLTMHSWSKTAMARCEIIDKPIVYPMDQTGLWGEAVRQRRAIITNDYPAPNPLKRGYPEGHVHVLRHMNIPVFDGERIVAVAGVGNKEAPYDDRDVRQLTLLMQGMWHILSRREDEANLRSAHDELETRVEERTAELANANAELKQTAKRLETARQVAETASAAKSTFLANMSHEIRTPLNAIIGMTELVLKSRLTAQQREFLGTVRDSGEALLSVINDILDFSKIEAGKMVLDASPFNLWESLGDTMKSFALRAHQADLELACYIHPEVPHLVSGDYARLRQVVVNLVGNAIKFTEQGEVVLEVWRESLAPPEVVLHFMVSDTGIGIPDEKQTAIFEMFEQADTSMRRRHGGTGLGLAIASRLVALMGGRIWVESQHDRGSRFHFTVRLELAESLPPKPKSPEPPSLRSLRVLVVDDNATNRRILEEVLRSWHMEPTVAGGAEQSLELMREAEAAGRPYQLVLTDAHMPHVDGFTLAEDIRKDAGLGSTMVMMLTSGDRPEDMNRCEQLGIAAYLLKPIKQSELLEAIELALGITAPREISAQHTAAPSVGRLRVLLAEDSLVNQKLAVALLEGQGHEVTVVANGREALGALESKSFDLVLMDVQMPEMDGLEATAAIRVRERHTGVRLPIVAMTAHALKGDRERCLEAGMDDYIAKPIRAEELYDAIRNAVDGTEPDGKSEATPNVREPVDSGVLWSTALEAAQGNRETLRVLVEAAVEEIPQLMESLSRAIAAADPQALHGAAHTLKGALRYFGAQSAFEHAFQLETMGRNGALEDPESVFSLLQEEIAAIHAALREFLQSSPETEHETFGE